MPAPSVSDAGSDHGSVQRPVVVAHPRPQPALVDNEEQGPACGVGHGGPRDGPPSSRAPRRCAVDLGQRPRHRRTWPACATAGRRPSTTNRSWWSCQIEEAGGCRGQEPGAGLDRARHRCPVGPRPRPHGERPRPALPPVVLEVQLRERHRRSPAAVVAHQRLERERRLPLRRRPASPSSDSGPSEVRPAGFEVRQSPTGRGRRGPAGLRPTPDGELRAAMSGLRCMGWSRKIHSASCWVSSPTGPAATTWSVVARWQPMSTVAVATVNASIASSPVRRWMTSATIVSASPRLLLRRLLTAPGAGRRRSRAAASGRSTPGSRSAAPTRPRRCARRGSRTAGRGRSPVAGR